MNLFGETLTVGAGCFLILALLLALSFEFVNGFHDTANAVATVIYTHTLKPVVAVVWSGCWNLIGVLMSAGTVAYSIVALLPVELVLRVGSGQGFAMVFALLISAIIWNIGTWYLGLPASSSHTLIGSILGVGLANSMLLPGHSFGEGVNWAKAREVFAYLLISPLIGFTFAALLLLLMKATIKRPDLYQAPEGEKPPPLWIRGLLVLTCTGVSWAHGSNDGQKGMGLIMLIMIGVLPATYALNMNIDSAALNKLAAASHSVSIRLDARSTSAAMPLDQASGILTSFTQHPAKADAILFAALSAQNHEIGNQLDGKSDLSQFTRIERANLRSSIYLVSSTLAGLDKTSQLTNAEEKKALMGYKKDLDKLTLYIPLWVKCAVALALGLGTMIGWKRIVVTVGEKIGKDHLTYAQGAAAELVTMITIEAADRMGMPVSTTHVLTSGVAGTMAANHAGIQMGTVRNLIVAWVLTLPVCVMLGACLFAAGNYFVLHLLGIH
jgi:PiT family inorganic phosphate transporter